MECAKKNYRDLDPNDEDRVKILNILALGVLFPLIELSDNELS